MDNSRWKEDNSMAEEDAQAEKAIVLENLKEDINNFLWSHLPPKTTLDEADKMAGEWHLQIYKLWGLVMPEEAPHD